LLLTGRVLNGGDDAPAWMARAYGDQSLVTQIGPLHADDAAFDAEAHGRPTSSSTLPGLLVHMYQHAILQEGLDILDVGTGSGYGCALLATRFGADHVTSVDVDPGLTKRAMPRLDTLGLQPLIAAVDATGALPGTYDRIIATVAVRPIPASWLTALRPGGRLVTTITGMNVILTANKTDDGGAEGRIEWDRAGFMESRSGTDYQPQLTEMFAAVRDAEGEQVSRDRYPVIDVAESWELYSMLGALAPGIEHHFEQDGEHVTAWMLHSDGSWARATGIAGEPSTVHQDGPRLLWDTLDDIRLTWLSDGSLPLYGARVQVDPDGTIHLRRGRWEATITE
jgi:protein-L-isoaspartate O-methyltransferase